MGRPSWSNHVGGDQPVADVEGGQEGPWPTLRLDNGLYTIGKKLKKIIYTIAMLAHPDPMG